MSQPFLPLLLLAAAPQQATPPVDAPQAEPETEEAEGEEVVVTGQRERGSVVGDIPPLQQFQPADIRSFGVGTVSELLAELGPQTRSGRGGPPVVLLDGRRISGFQEIRDLPTEAIARAVDLDVGGVEVMIDDRDGVARFYDINALSNFVARPLDVLGWDPHDRLVDYLIEQIGKTR